jgi:hypothetical protein
VFEEKRDDIAPCAHQFIVHAALDIVDELVPQSNAL